MRSLTDSGGCLLGPCCTLMHLHRTTPNVTRRPKLTSGHTREWTFNQYPTIQQQQHHSGQAQIFTKIKKKKKCKEPFKSKELTWPFEWPVRLAMATNRAVQCTIIESPQCLAPFSETNFFLCSIVDQLIWLLFSSSRSLTEGTRFNYYWCRPFRAIYLCRCVCV